MRTLVYVSLLCIAGCTRPNAEYAPPPLTGADTPVSPSTVAGPAPGTASADLARPFDLAQPFDDLAQPFDLAVTSDLATPADLATQPDLTAPYGTCPPAGTSPISPPSLGDLHGEPCNFACWGYGTLFNLCATGRYQFCLPSGHFAPCQHIH